MTEHVSGTPLGGAPANGMNLDDADAEAILDGTAPNDHSLEQVREILFGAQSRRFETERRALESKTTERFARLEAEYERRFEQLLRDLHQRFDKTCAMLEAESAERREAPPAVVLPCLFETTACKDESRPLPGPRRKQRNQSSVQ